MRVTCLRPSARLRLSAEDTPIASSLRHLRDRHIHEISAMPANSGHRPSSESSHSASAVASIVSTTVESVSQTAAWRRFPARARKIPSIHEM